MAEIKTVTPDFAVAPQLAPGDMGEAAERGFTLVINNRPDDEVPGQPTSAEMQAAAEAVSPRRKSELATMTLSRIQTFW